jgi:hypothetical protein
LCRVIRQPKLKQKSKQKAEYMFVTPQYCQYDVGGWWGALFGQCGLVFIFR